MAAKPYLEGKTWSFRLRIKGQEIYRKGFATAAKASNEAERLRQKILTAGKPKHNGPWRTTLGQALQAYARERLPFMKGAKQEACRINRYLCACGLNIVKVTPASESETRPSETENTVVHFEVSFKPGNLPRKVAQGLNAHRQRQADRKIDTDRLRHQLAKTPMAEVMPYQIQELVSAMSQDGYGPATVGLERALLRAVFNYAKNTWLWVEPTRNPAEKLNMPKIDNARDRVLTNAEWKKICTALELTRNPHVAPLLALLLETAMRASEPLLHATWDDVDLERCILHLRDAKAGPRDVPLNPGAIQVLRYLKTRLETELAARPKSKRKPKPETGITDPRIFPITYESLKAAWQRACERAGIEGVNIHDLRHTAATRFTLELHGNLPVLKVITGHKTFSQLSRYINVKPADVVRLLHNRPLTEDDAPAGLHPEKLRLVGAPPTAQTWDPADLPANVVPIARHAG